MFFHIFDAACCLWDGLTCLRRASTPEAAAQTAEYIFFSARNAKSRSAWINQLSFTADHRAQALAFAKGHHLPEPLPTLSYSASGSQILVQLRHKVLRIELKSLPAERLLVLNGTSVALDSAITIDQAAVLIEKALNKRVGWFEFLGLDQMFLTKAHAASETEAEWMKDAQFWGSVSYIVGADQLDACFGREAVSRTLCHLRHDDKMIQKDLAPFQINTFECDNQKFKKLTYQLEDRSDSVLEVKYDGAGKMTEIHSAAGDSTCTYKLQNEKLEDIVYSSDPDAARDCNRATPEHQRGQPFPKPLEYGDQIKATANVPVPLARLQRCCADRRCQNEMAKVVSKPEARADSSESSSEK